MSALTELSTGGGIEVAEGRYRVHRRVQVLALVGQTVTNSAAPTSGSVIKCDKTEWLSILLREKLGRLKESAHSERLNVSHSV